MLSDLEILQCYIEVEFHFSKIQDSACVDQMEKSNKLHIQSTPLNRDTFVFGSLSRLSGVPN